MFNHNNGVNANALSYINNLGCSTKPILHNFENFMIKKTVNSNLKTLKNKTIFF